MEEFEKSWKLFSLQFNSLKSVTDDGFADNSAPKSVNQGSLDIQGMSEQVQPAMDAANTADAVENGLNREKEGVPPRPKPVQEYAG